MMERQCWNMVYHKNKSKGTNTRQALNDGYESLFANFSSGNGFFPHSCHTYPEIPETNIVHTFVISIHFCIVKIYWPDMYAV